MWNTNKKKAKKILKDFDEAELRNMKGQRKKNFYFN